MVVNSPAPAVSAKTRAPWVVPCKPRVSEPPVVKTALAPVKATVPVELPIEVLVVVEVLMLTGAPLMFRALAPVEAMVPAPAKVRAVALVAIVSREATPVKAPPVETLRPPALVRAKLPVALPIATVPVPVVAIVTLEAPAVAKLVTPLELRVVKAPVPGVPEPIGPGAPKVAPFSEEAFKLATLVVEAITSGAVPVVRVEVIWPEAEMVVKAPEAAVVAPIWVPLIPVAVVLKVEAPVPEVMVRALVPKLNELAALPTRLRAPVAPPLKAKVLAPVEAMVPAPAKVRAVALVAIVSSEATPLKAPPVETLSPPALVRAKLPVALPIATVPVPVVAMVTLEAPAVAKFVTPLELRVVKAPVPGVPEPIGPGAAKVAPFSEEAFRLATLVVEAITSGAVPVVTVEVIWPEAETVVKAPEAAVVAPIWVPLIPVAVVLKLEAPVPEVMVRALVP